MSDPRILDHNPDTGITEYYHFDPDTHGFVIETRQDVTDLIELNKYRQNADHGRYGEMNLVASYPLSILMDLVQKGHLDTNFRVLDEKKHRAWLNDPENAVWRTRFGRV